MRSTANTSYGRSAMVSKEELRSGQTVATSRHNPLMSVSEVGLEISVKSEQSD